jgi:hypothetical protein
MTIIVLLCCVRGGRLEEMEASFVPLAVVNHTSRPRHGGGAALVMGTTI